MDAATIRDINAFYKQGLKAPLMVGKRGREAIVDWEDDRSPGEWIKLLRDRWRGLIADAIEQGHDHLFEYTNTSDALALFPLSAAIRFAAGKTCTAPLIDFLCSPAGITFAAQGQGVDGADGRRIVNVKVLTVAQSLAWFDGDGDDRDVEGRIRPWDSDYVIG
ncbi:hypothetical protein QFC20_005976 [Naganishia adeliensis]|uniref:Uncharacterized protein n=1 Tax=Naganishia adeliensis TaxID=92952 RepID=A0ACC2VIA9_9TREE|nr:hypothetical protein QFC20_005976 [Naganishia adeliensis]